MALTGLVKDELSRVSVLKPCCRKAEVSTILRFAGGLHLAAGRIVVEAELDTGAAARRLRKDIAEVFGHASDLVVLAPGGCARAIVTSSACTPTARAWPGSPVWSTTTGVRFGACRGRWSPAPPATVRRPGAVPSSRTAA